MAKKRKRKYSRGAGTDLRYMASARIPQFESYMRSHAVRLPTRPPILKGR